MTKKEITISGALFLVSQPYAAGHVVTEAEAKALNQVRAENIRNNMASKVKAANDGTAKDGEPTAENIVQAVANYDADYQFTLASVGGGRKATDPVEVEARKIAKTILVAKLAEKNIKFSALPKEKADELLAALCENEKVIKAAKKALKDRADLASASLDSMDLGLDDGGETGAGETETETASE